jgi:hypothetical protein
MNYKKLYLTLAFFSTLAAVQSIIFPRWPKATIIPIDRLSLFKSNVLSNDKVVDSSLVHEGHSDYNRSHTPIVSLKIHPKADLLLTNVQVRDVSDFSISYITESIKSLRLNNSATKSKQPPFFLSQRSPAGTTFQTCFVSGNSLPTSFGVDQDQMSLAVDQVNPVETNLGIKRYLGLRPSRRYQCMLITLKSTLPSQESYRLWRDLLEKLQSTFN